MKLYDEDELAYVLGCIQWKEQALAYLDVCKLLVDNEKIMQNDLVVHMVQANALFGLEMCFKALINLEINKFEPTHSLQKLFSLLSDKRKKTVEEVLDIKYNDNDFDVPKYILSVTTDYTVVRYGSHHLIQPKDMILALEALIAYIQTEMPHDFYSMLEEQESLRKKTT